MMNSIAWLVAGLWLFLLARILNPKSRYDRFHPVRIIAWAWALMFFLSATQIIKFPTVELAPWVYLIGFASLLMIGTLIGAGRGTKSAARGKNATVEDFTISPESIIFAKVVIIVGVIGLIANLYVIFIGRPVDFSDFDKLRNPDLRDVIGTTTWADRIVYLTLPFTWMSLIVTCLFSEKLEGRFRLLALASIVGLILFGAMSAGRTIQVRVILLVLTAGMVRRGMGLRAWPFRWTPSRSVLMVILTVAATWYFFVFVWSLRAGGITNLSVEAGMFHKDASESVLLSGLPKAIPYYVRSLITFIALYTTTISDNFASFYANVNLEPYGGMWQLQSLISATTQFGLPVKPIHQMLLEVSRGYEAVGLRHTQWRTMAQEFILDFGKVGALGVIFFNGIVMGYVYRKFKQGEAQFGALLAFMLMWIIFGAWTSPYSYFELQQLFYFGGMALLISFMKTRRSASRPGYRAALPFARTSR